MISSEVERTLVKSPPELWTELSNPDALARHLGEFGEIRITRVEPEHAVEWEAGDTAGTVRIKPSGWGTKVTLTATREIEAPARPVAVEPAAEPPAAAEPALSSEPDPVAHEEIEPAAKPIPAPPPASEPEPNVLANATAEPAPAQPHLDPEPSRGFLSRLFGSRRRRKAAEHPREPAPAACEPRRPNAETADAGLQSTQPAPEQGDPFTTIREALYPLTMTAVDPFPTPHLSARSPVEGEIEMPPNRAANHSADLKTAEEVAAEEVTSVLTSVLDRLGAAHHRPFSRA
jgi:hypothetical protein